MQTISLTDLFVAWLGLLSWLHCLVGCVPCTELTFGGQTRELLPIHIRECRANQCDSCCCLMFGSIHAARVVHGSRGSEPTPNHLHRARFDRRDCDESTSAQWLVTGEMRTD